LLILNKGLTQDVTLDCGVGEVFFTKTWVFYVLFTASDQVCFLLSRLTQIGFLQGACSMGAALEHPCLRKFWLLCPIAETAWVVLDEGVHRTQSPDGLGGFVAPRAAGDAGVESAHPAMDRTYANKDAQQLCHCGNCLAKTEFA
jgi:hypothetical protein